MRLAKHLIQGRFVCVAVFLVSIIVFSVGRAQQDVAESIPVEEQRNGLTPDSMSMRLRQEFVPRWYDMFANIPNDWVRYGRASFTTDNIPAIIGMGAVTAVLIATDDATWKASDKWYKRSSFVKSASDIGELVGDGKTQFGLAGAFALYGFLAEDNRALRTASQTVETILACGTVVQVLKHVTGRESPLVSTEPGGAWRFFPNQIEYHKHVPHYDAYPSGHVATALATVTVVAENYPEAGWIRPVGYSLVGILAVSMVNTGIHWYSDYPLGLALGYSFGMIAAHPERLNVVSEKDDSSVKLSLAPYLSPYGSGIQLAMSF